MSLRLFLDDLRTPPPGYRLFRTAAELRAWVEGHGLEGVEEISLDHDLGEGETGYDFVNWLERYVVAHGLRELPRIVSHSANPVGRSNIERAAERLQRWVKGGEV